ncbi:hypothetical protein AGR4C_pb30004 [Agrobacterium tumefaciens str. Kerr 14]|uniref:Uncharacterized protein n=1 Tax=Agrobacterium tumefaciens str. Kerr 14 TaxID=1183424 RepID=A0A1S7SEC7_AGRTU|nr:hypothetical protein AGR4C_pb30004 [Agrobacterium tumefaciens str. Kerr 14]
MKEAVSQDEKANIEASLVKPAQQVVPLQDLMQEYPVEEASKTEAKREGSHCSVVEFCHR